MANHTPVRESFCPRCRTTRESYSNEDSLCDSCRSDLREIEHRQYNEEKEIEKQRREEDDELYNKYRR